MLCRSGMEAENSVRSKTGISGKGESLTFAISYGANTIP